MGRIMGNLDFIDSFSGAYVVFQPYKIFDHSSTVLKIHSLTHEKHKPFKFFNFLTFKSTFLNLVSNSWQQQVDGCYMFQVVSKMKSMKKPLRKLMHDQGNLHKRVNKLWHELDEVQRALDLNSADSILWEEEAIYSVKSRNQRSRIEVIMDEHNVKVSGSNVLGVFVVHYENFLGTNMLCDDLNVEGLFQKKVLSTTYANLARQVTDMEIKDAMFDIGDDRASGPDGYTSAFFKRS
ncbi:hypothetical protein Tco_1514723 [Tanacetum coccineum]